MDGAKCISEGGKHLKICQKWLILTIFSSDCRASGGRASKGVQMPPCPLDATTAFRHILTEIILQECMRITV